MTQRPLLHYPDTARWQRHVIARVARGNLVRNRLDTVALFAILRRGFARDSAHSPVKACARASRGIQHTRFGRALSGGKDGVGGRRVCWLIIEAWKAWMLIVISVGL